MKAALNLRAEITARLISFLKTTVKMASGRHIMPLMFSSTLHNRDMMPLFSMTTGYRVVSAGLTAAFTPPKVTTPREILHLHKRLYHI